MVRCRKCIPCKPNDPSPYPTMQVCPRGARVFYRVEYSELSHYYRNESRYEDTFGFCDGCAPRMARLQSWTVNDRSVHGIRGTVKSVRKIELSTAEAKELKQMESKLRLIDSVRADFMRKMQQKNVAELSPEDWETAFRSAINDYTVQWVQNR